MRRKIPHFDSLEEESEFWDNVDTTDFIDPDEPEVQVEWVGRLANSISLRMDDNMLAELKRLATKRRMGYQTMMRMWVAERLEQELAAERAAEAAGKPARRKPRKAPEPAKATEP